MLNGMEPSPVHSLLGQVSLYGKLEVECPFLGTLHLKSQQSWTQGALTYILNWRNGAWHTGPPDSGLCFLWLTSQKVRLLSRCALGGCCFHSCSLVIFPVLPVWIDLLCAECATPSAGQLQGEWGFYLESRFTEPLQRGEKVRGFHSPTQKKYSTNWEYVLFFKG